MDPDPNLIGQAFVKQYYTQLHHDPTQMHRFYLDQSSFVHGGSEVGSAERVVGQMAIHQKILSMDLQQVHAKIKQVDSDTTLGDGIAIQVTGELSTGGRAMRAFVQMFVLAPESPKKYYVRNDFFRYQDDDIVSESETNDGPGEGESVAVGDQPSEEMDYHQQQSTGSIPSEGMKEGDTLYGSQGAELIAMGDQTLQEEGSNIGGGASWDQFPREPTRIPERQQNGLPEEGLSETTHPAPPTSSGPSDMLPLDPPGGTEGDGHGTESEGFAMETPETETGKGTWADRLSRGFGTSAAPKPSPQPPSLPASAPLTSRPVSTTSQSLPQRDSKPRRTERAAQKEYVPRKGQATRDVPDANQIFVGGLPAGSTETELREVFLEFGAILDVRINPKNFAFIVFESPDSVQKIIQEKERLQVRSRQLNIEQKRPATPRSGGMQRHKANITPGGGGERGERGGGGGGGGRVRNNKPPKR